MLTALRTISALFIACLLLTTSLVGQSNGAHYYFDGNEVVFEFDRQAYIQAAFLDTSDALVFSDLNITEILVLDKDRATKKKGWKMVKVAEDIYQLRKPIQEFGDGFSGQHKYLINKKYWLVPINVQDTYLCPEDIIEQVYREDPYSVSINPAGNARFVLNEFPDARRVILTGSFNGWNEDQFNMQRIGNKWQITLDLPLGKYEYKFIVDREWVHDKSNPYNVKNEHGTLNSVIDLRDNQRILLTGYENAKEVMLSGTFNGWSRTMKMQKEDGKWAYDLNLSPGKYFYKFIVDGQWITDPINKYIEQDFYGNKNSVLIVH